MRKSFLAVAAFLIVSFTYAQEAVVKATEVKEGPMITFAESTKSFGDITQGDVVQHIFQFTNEGTQPLILSNVLTTCGCTATEWPRDPIAPGKSGEIHVKFNSAGKMGPQNKIVTIVSNATNPKEKVSIKTNVLPKKDTKKDTE
ncbi:MAG: DUF1573 domain-containing protein [Cyclobacteriaceae bacterium]